MTRDYVVDIQNVGERLPLLTVLGGKLTTYRRLAEHALDKLHPYFPRLGPAWTNRDPLPGGDMENADFARFLAEFQARHRWLPTDLARRYARAYGTRAERMIGGAKGIEGFGPCLGDQLYVREVEYLRDREWAATAEDILWRRSKLGLHVSAATKSALAAYLDGAVAPSGAAMSSR